MSAEWKCRECAVPLSGAAHVMLPSPLKGNRGLCLACSDKIASKYHAHVLHDWIPRYTKDQRQLTETQALRAEISELRAMLDQLTNPER